MRKVLTREELIEYCQKKQIFVPNNATREYLEAAIVRAHDHLGEPKDEETCFGCWAHENSACLICTYEGKCFEASMGMSKESYFKALKKEENPKIRFAERLKKSRKGLKKT